MEDPGRIEAAPHLGTVSLVDAVRVALVIGLLPDEPQLAAMLQAQVRIAWARLPVEKQKLFRRISRDLGVSDEHRLSELRVALFRVTQDVAQH